MIAFAVHAIIVVGVISLESTRGGANVYGWDIYRLFRLVDAPVLWVIDYVLQHFFILRIGWFAPHFELGYSTNVALTYVLIGGAFYAALAAALTLWRNPRNAGPTGENGVGNPSGMNTVVTVRPGCDLKSVSVALAGLFALVLSVGPAAPARGADSGPATSPKSCGIDGFTKSPSEDIVVELEKSLRVKSVEGVITSQSGGWPEGTFVIFELRATRGAGRLRQVKADSRGSFKMPDVPPGEYCFKATADGWQSVVGVIVVTKAADPAARVSFEMLLGV